MIFLVPNGNSYVIQSLFIVIYSTNLFYCLKFVILMIYLIDFAAIFLKMMKNLYRVAFNNYDSLMYLYLYDFYSSLSNILIFIYICLFFKLDLTDYF
jgi:hypothetical protein